MGIPFLMGLLFGAGVFFAIYYSYEKKDKTPDKKIKWVLGTIFAVVGIIVGGVFSELVGEKIAKKCSVSQASLRVLETVDLLPFCGSLGAYIVTGENNNGKKVAWYLQEDQLFEEPYNDIVDRKMIVFTNVTAPAKQLVKVNVGSFWKWFVIIPNIQRLVIPAGGLHKGMIIKTYKFIPVYPE